MSYLMDKVQYIKQLLREKPDLSNQEIYQIYGPTINALPGFLLTIDGLITLARQEMNESNDKH